MSTDKLYRIQKIFDGTSVLAHGHVERKESPDAHSPGNQEAKVPPEVTAAAAGASEGRHIVAVFMSSGDLIFHYTNKLHVPVTQRVPWFEDVRRRVAAMSFSPDGHWLLCVFPDGTIALIPIRVLTDIPLETQRRPGEVRADKTRPRLSSLSSGDAGGYDDDLPSILSFVDGDSSIVPGGKQSELHTVNDITIMPSTSRTRLTGVSCCILWRSFDGQDYAIIGTLAGLLSIVDLSTQTELCVFRLKYPVLSIHMVEDPKSTYKYIFLNTIHGGYWRLQLEALVSRHVEGEAIEKDDDDDFQRPGLERPTEESGQRWTGVPSQYSSVVTNCGEVPYVPELVIGIPPSSRLLVYSTERWGALVGVHHPASQRLEVYDAELNKFPLFVYQLPADSTFVYVSNDIIFAVRSNDDGDHDIVSMVSRLGAGMKAAVSGDPVAREESIVEEHIVPQGQRVCGILVPPKSDAASRIRSDGWPPVPLFFVWTPDCIFSCHMQQTPETAFNRMVQSASIPMEIPALEKLGKAFGLDLYTLYESAADSLMKEDNSTLAFELYLLSNVRTGKLIQQFINADRLEVVVQYLENVLAKPGSLPRSDRRRYSNVLLRCFLCQLLAGEKKGHSVDALVGRFEAFLMANADFDVVHGMQLLNECGMATLLLKAARSRDRLPDALMMIIKGGGLHVAQDDGIVEFLRDCGCINRVANPGSSAVDAAEWRVLFRSMPSATQVKVLLEIIEHTVTVTPCSTIMYQMQWLQQLLPYLGDVVVATLANALDPRNNRWKMLSQRTKVAKSQKVTEKAVRDKWMEVYFLCLIQLDSRRRGSGDREAAQDASAVPSLTPASSSESLANLVNSPGSDNDDDNPTLHIPLGRLESDLSTFWEMYAPETVAKHCHNAKCFGAVATIYGLLGNPVEAFKCQLCSIVFSSEKKVDSSNPSSRKGVATVDEGPSEPAYSLCEKVIALGNTWVLDSSRSGQEVTSMLREIFSVWHAMKLPFPALEAWIAANLSTLGASTASILFLRNEREARHALDSVGASFTHSLRLAVTASLLQRGVTEENKVYCTLPEKLFSEIRYNLEKHIDRRSSVTVNASQLPHQESILTGTKDHVVFTCGHMFGLSHFLGSVLPNFRASLQEHNGHTQAWVELLLADYAEDVTRNACPDCVLKSI